MTIFLIILGSIVALIIGGILMYRKAKKADMKRWRVGDELCLSYYNNVAKEVYKNKKSLIVKLVAWSSKEVIFDADDGYIRRVKYGEIDCNKSADWRDLEADCAKAMGKPDFKLNPVIKEFKEKAKEFFDGKHVELLSEIELQVYLKKALAEDKFEEASKIRDQLKKFR